jgi:hypothetical protein
LLASTSDIALERSREKLWNRAYIIGHPALKRRDDAKKTSVIGRMNKKRILHTETTETEKGPLISA